MTYTAVWDTMTNKPSETMIQRDADQAFIPFDDGNRDYQEYKLWLASGKKPTSVVAPPQPEPALDPWTIIKELQERIKKLEEEK